MVVYLLIIGSLFFHQKKQQRLRAMTLNVIITASKKILVVSKYEIIMVPSNYSFLQFWVITMSIWRAIQKRSTKSMYKTDKKKSKRLRATTCKVERAITKWGIFHYCYHNIGKMSIFGAPIIYFPTVFIPSKWEIILVTL